MPASNGEQQNNVPLLLQVLEQLIELNAKVSAVDVRVEHLDTKLSDHMEDEEKEKRLQGSTLEQQKGMIERLTSEVSTLVKVVDAFPLIEGKPDFNGHRGYHEVLIDDASRSKKRWNQIKDNWFEKLVNGLIYGSIFLCLLGGKTWILGLLKEAAILTVVK